MTSAGKKLLIFVAMLSFAVAIALVAIYGQSSGWFVVWFVIGFAAIITILVCPEQSVPARWGVRDELSQFGVLICTVIIIVMVVSTILIAYFVMYAADLIMTLFLATGKSKSKAT